MKKLLLLAALTALTQVIHGAASSSNSSQPAAAPRQIRSLQELAAETAAKNTLANEQKIVNRVLSSIGSLFGYETTVFASEESLKNALKLKEKGIQDYIFEASRPFIARAYFLHVKGFKGFKADTTPKWLQTAFHAYLQEPGAGFSVQDLIDNNMIPTIEDNRLDLSFSIINNLAGLQYIPGINNVHRLFLSSNRLADIQPEILTKLINLRHLHLNGNRLADIQPGAFAGLINLELIDLGNNPMTKETEERIRQEIQHIAPNARFAIPLVLRRLNGGIERLVFDGLGELQELNLEQD